MVWPHPTPLKRREKYATCDALLIFFIRNCKQISWAGASVTLNIPVKSLLNDKTVKYNHKQQKMIIDKIQTKQFSPKNEIKTTWLTRDQAVAPVKT